MRDACLCGAPDCSSCFPYTYNYRPGPEPCNGPADDCSGCERCMAEVCTRKIVTARKARRNIKPGDRVLVLKGFVYQIGGPRLEYFKREHKWSGR